METVARRALEDARVTPTAPDDELESPTREADRLAGALATALAIGLALYSLYWVVGIVQPLVYRVSFLLIVLVLSFMFYPAIRAARDSRRACRRIDWLLASRSPSWRWRGRSSTSTTSSIAPPIRPRATWRSAPMLHPARARGDAAHGGMDAAGHGHRASSSTRSTGRCSISSASG